MIGPGLLAGLGGPVWAKFALIGASLSYALRAMFAKRFKGVPPAIVATGQLTASTIIMLPVVLRLVRHAPNCSPPAPPVWAAVFALALLSTAFAYILYFSVDRLGRRHQRLAGDADRAGQRHPARRAVPRRTAGTVRSRRHGSDRRSAW